MTQNAAYPTMEQTLSKVPAVTLGFWVIKVLATTLGETGGDAVSMTWLGETTDQANGWGYLIGTGIFTVILAVFVAAQIRARKFKPWLYWATIIASTTAGTTLADYFTRTVFKQTFGLNQTFAYLLASIVLLSFVLITLLIWRRALGTIDPGSIASPRAELFYWVTITFSQTLGTALGDWTVDSGFGYLGGAMIFGTALALVALLYYERSRLSNVTLFWAAFILTRPLGATVGDFLDKPLDHGGLALSRPIASLVLFGLIAALIWLLPQRAGEHPGKRA